MPHGLGDAWYDIRCAYSDIPAVYDSTNRIISLGMDTTWREDVVCIASHLVRKGRRALVLDAGSGTGAMSEIMAGKTKITPVLFDYSIAMLKKAGGKKERIQGVFEALPFRDSTFDCILMGFSLHAARDMERSVSELSRVSRGVIAIVGFGKPGKGLKRVAGEAYLRYAIPALASLSAGKRSASYHNIYRIYERLPENQETARIISKGFYKIMFREKALGTIIQYVGSKR